MSRKFYKDNGRAEMSARIAGGGGWWLSDCPYTGWRREAWQAGAWSAMQSARKAGK